MYIEKFFVHLIDNPKTPTNRYAIEGDIGMPHGALFIKPVYDEELENVEKELQKAIGEKSSSEIEIITDVIIGKIGFRRIAPEGTYQYKALKKLTE